jgi:hypothetical protein
MWYSTKPRSQLQGFGNLIQFLTEVGSKCCLLRRMKKGTTRSCRWPLIPPATLKCFISIRGQISREAAPRQQFVVTITSTLFLRLSSRISTDVTSNLQFIYFVKRESSSPHNTLSFNGERQLMCPITNLLLLWVSRMKKGATASFVAKS